MSSASPRRRSRPTSPPFCRSSASKAARRPSSWPPRSKKRRNCRSRPKTTGLASDTPTPARWNPARKGAGFQGSLAVASGLAAVLTVVDQFADDGGIGERRGVAEHAVFVFRDLAQDAPHDLARAGL